jgi:hypothetical protein
MAHYATNGALSTDLDDLHFPSVLYSQDEPSRASLAWKVNRLYVVSWIVKHFARCEPINVNARTD